MCKEQSRTNDSQEENNFSQNINLPDSDKKWLRACEKFILGNLTSEFLSVAWISLEFNLSEFTLTRHLKTLIGLSRGKYNIELRLNQAKELLSSNMLYSVSELSNKVGFQDHKAYSRSFLKKN